MRILTAVLLCFILTTPGCYSTTAEFRAPKGMLVKVNGGEAQPAPMTVELTKVNGFVTVMSAISVVGLVPWLFASNRKDDIELVMPEPVLEGLGFSKAEIKDIMSRKANSISGRLRVGRGSGRGSIELTKELLAPALMKDGIIDYKYTGPRGNDVFYLELQR